ncbi:MAG TPA: hypothetical protein VK956_03510, partial [Verrucomicrobium sp.]|nr:hypothetical protein [Verrucomicrobium sp.]
MFTSIIFRPFRSSSLALLTFSCLTSLGLAGPLLEYEGPVNAMSQGEVAARVQIANNITRDRSSNGTLWIRFSTEVTAYLSSDKENAGGMFGGLQLLRDGQENL